MRVFFAPWKALLIAGTAAAAVAACAVGVGGPGYDGYDAVGYVGGYYEPWGYEYGGWGGRYRVGPPRGGFGRGGVGHPSPGGHPGGGRSAPSIPSRAHR